MDSSFVNFFASHSNWKAFHIIGRARMSGARIIKCSFTPTLWWMMPRHSKGFFGNSWFMTRSSISFAGSKIIVRPEEALIVILVLLLWVGAIGLFVHRWGKIRNCEPYAPKFEADDLPSCPLVSMDPIVVQKRMSLGPLTSIQCGSSWNPNAIGMGRGEQQTTCKLLPRGRFQLTFSSFLARSVFTLLSASTELRFRRRTPFFTTTATKKDKICCRYSFTFTWSRMRSLVFKAPNFCKFFSLADFRNY